MVLAIHAIAVKRVLQIKTLSTFDKMIKNKTLKEVHNYFIEILGFDEKSSEIKSNIQKNKEYDELDRFLKLPQCHQNNANAHKRKADTNETFIEFFDFRHFEKKLHVAESKLVISCNIIDDFRRNLRSSGREIVELIDECCN
jgi:hypothetical protein